MAGFHPSQPLKQSLLAKWLSSVNRRVIAREAIVCSFFIVAAVLMTWPLAINLRTAISDPGDPFFTTWAIDWDYQALLGRVPLFDANIFSPNRVTLALSENMLGLALLAFPLLAIGIEPLTVHNIGVLAAFAACGYSMYLLCRWVTGASGPSIIGGVCYAFVGFRFHHLPHLHFLWSAWLPLLLLATLLYVRRPTITRGVAYALVFLMNGLTSLHWFVFGAVASVFVVVFLAAPTGQGRSPRYWGIFAAALSVALLCMMPVLLPYQEVARLYDIQRYFGDALPNSAEWSDWLEPNYQNRLYGKWSRPETFSHERTLFPGFLPSLLAIWGFFYSRREHVSKAMTITRSESFSDAPIPRLTLRILDVITIVAGITAAVVSIVGEVPIRIGSYNVAIIHGPSTPLLIAGAVLLFRCWFEVPALHVHPHFRGLREAVHSSRHPVLVWGVLVWLCVGVFGARGLRGIFHTFLFEHLAAFRGIRMPIRWAMVAYVGVALFAALGANRIIFGKRPLTRFALSALLAMATLAELRVAPMRWYLAPLEPPRVYSWIRDLPLRGGIFEMPMTQQYVYWYLWFATIHHKPLINGVSSYLPPSYGTLTEVSERTPLSDALLDSLEASRCSLIVVHQSHLGTRAPVIRSWLQAMIAAGRLTFIRRFDLGARSDYVFALTRIEPDAIRWREPEVPDPSGRTPMMNLDAFLTEADPWTYGRDPYVSMDARPLGTFRGKLEVSGWAVAPEGIRDIRLRFANGRTVVPADGHERADVTSILYWFKSTKAVGFSKTFDAPVRGVDGETDMQVEVTTNAGRRHRMTPFWFKWYPPLTSKVVWKEPALSDLIGRLGHGAEELERLTTGNAAITDFTQDLWRDPEIETDRQFVERVASTLLIRAPDERAVSRYLRLLVDGASRDRVIREVIGSSQFQQMYVERGVAVAP